MTLRLRGRNGRPMKTTSVPFQRAVASGRNLDIARPLSGDDVNARASRARGLCGKRSDQSGANTAITVAFVEINMQMARIGIAQ